jgi:hypothetical protein
LTTANPVLGFPCGSDHPVRVLMADAIRRPVRQSSFGDGGFFDIVRPPGGRLKFPQTIRVAHPVPKTRSPTPSGQIRVNPGKSDLWNAPEWLHFGLWPEASLPRPSRLKPLV